MNLHEKIKAYLESRLSLDELEVQDLDVLTESIINVVAEHLDGVQIALPIDDEG